MTTPPELPAASNQKIIRLSSAVDRYRHADSSLQIDYLDYSGLRASFLSSPMARFDQSSCFQTFADEIQFDESGGEFSSKSCASARDLAA